MRFPLQKLFLKRTTWFSLNLTNSTYSRLSTNFLGKRLNVEERNNVKGSVALAKVPWLRKFLSKNKGAAEQSRWLTRASKSPQRGFHDSPLERHSLRFAGNSEICRGIWWCAREGFLWECRSANTGFTSALCRKTEKERKRKERERVKGRESETGTASRLVRVRISSRIREKSSKRVLVPGRTARYRSQYRAFPFLLSKRPYTQGRATTEITAHRRNSESRPILRTFSRANIAE